MKIPKICIAGKNRIAVNGLLFAMKHFSKDEICICPNLTDDGVSRWQPSLRRFAVELGIPTVDLRDLYPIDDLIFLSLEYDRLVKPALFKTKKLFNIHFSLLPAYKGMYTSAWPILNGESRSGVTLHKIDYGIDTGEIIAQSQIYLNESITARELYFTYMQSAAELLHSHFHLLLKDAVESTPQQARGSTYFSKKSIRYDNLFIDFNNTAEVISRQIRAFSFREYQMPKIQGQAVCSPSILPVRSTATPGTIFPHDNGFVISSIDYDVHVKTDESLKIFEVLASGDASRISEIDDKSTLNMTNNNGHTALMMAAYAGKKYFCNALISVGVDVNKSNQNETTPLMYAKSYGVLSEDFSIAQLLIEAGANIHAKDAFGKSVIDYSHENNESSAIKFFLNFT